MSRSRSVVPEVSGRSILESVQRPRLVCGRVTGRRLKDFSDGTMSSRLVLT